MSSDDAARRWLNQYRAAERTPDSFATWDHRLGGGEWRVLPVRAGHAGTVRKVRISKGTVMPSINIPAPIRFGLYLLASLGSIVVIYATEKGWAGDAENQLWTGFAGLLTLLAASKTPLNERDENGDIGVLEALVIVILVVVLVALLGGLR